MSKKLLALIAAAGASAVAMLPANAWFPFGTFTSSLAFSAMFSSMFSASFFGFGIPFFGLGFPSFFSPFCW